APEIADATRPVGHWNHLYLRVAPQQSEVAMNGVKYFYFRKGTDDWNKRVAASKFAKFENFGKADSGHICLQDHGDAVSFRNIKIRELPEDGSVPDPVDGKLAVRRVNPFPKLKWEGFECVDQEGRVQSIRPVVLTHGGDGSGQIYVASQAGMIHRLPDKNGENEAKLLLDLRGKVTSWRKSNEEGLLGLAFHPQFKKNRELFVYYTISGNTPFDPDRSSVVSRFRMADDGASIDPASEEVLLKVPQPFLNNNGGSIEFGPDGFLYIGLGDGGGFNDPAGNGQNLKTLLGSILRIDVDRRTDDRPFAIPKDNPFVGRSDARDEIFAYGFRNVWKLGFDRLTGRLWVADVGQDLWEEIDIVERGGNYGWSVREGMHPFGSSTARPVDKPIDPVWEYDHRVGRSITGGVVYRGKEAPVLEGYYVYADYVSGKVWALKYDDQAGTVIENMSLFSSGAPVLAFGEDEAGALYYLTESPGARSIYRFEE
ncbi:MAG: PQQ-dependent sugar dehydrogenase, partial [Planctomycetales bacterium]